MSKDILIRRVIPADLPSLIVFFISLNEYPVVRRYYRAFPTDSPTRLLRTVAELIKYVAPVVRSNYIMYAAFDAGDVVGVCHLELKGDAAMYGIVVHPRYWGLGLGKALSTAAIEEVRDRVRYIFLTVDEDNVRAVSLYERLGFEFVGKIPDCVVRNGEVLSCLVAVLTLR